MTKQYFFVSIGVHAAVILVFILCSGIFSSKDQVIDSIQMVDASPAGGGAPGLPGGGLKDIAPPPIATPPVKEAEKAILKKEEPENTIKFNETKPKKTITPKKIIEKPPPPPPPKKIESHLRDKLKDLLAEEKQNAKEDKTGTGSDSEKKNNPVKASTPAPAQATAAAQEEAAPAPDSSTNTPG